MQQVPEVSKAMQITPEQMRQLGSASQADFERRLLAHLQQRFPEQMRRADAGTSLQLVRHLQARAGHWGLDTESHTVAYAELALQLHPRFDEHPDHGWAQQVLADEFIIDPALRLELLLQAAQPHLARPAPTQSMA